MRFGGLVIACVAGILAVADAAHALKLSGKDRWVAVASSRDLDTAIGIARLHAHLASRVVLSKNGWYGVVFGPYQVKDIASFEAGYTGWPPLPPDALLSRGANYVETAWAPPGGAIIARQDIDRTGHATLRVGALVVSMAGTRYDETVGVIGEVAGRRLFDAAVPDNFYADHTAELKAVWLDPSTTYPQIVLSRFSGGAHCCTATWILSERPGGGWSFTEAGELDGGGYAFEDVDGDGAAELLSVDDSFHYVFDAYAFGNPPLRIARFAAGVLTDVSADPAFVVRYRQEIAGMEYLAKVEPDRWRSNGFLAGWVAAKARIGEFDQAWQKMLPLYDRNNDFGLATCPGVSENCSSSDLVRLSFLDSLNRLLREEGYLGSIPVASNPDRLPVLLGGSVEIDACSASGQVRGLDPRLDGFLSVRAGPASSHDEIDRLYEGDQIFICDVDGDWYAVVYPADGRVDCGVSTPWPDRRAYSGRCQAGWVHSRWIVGIAG